MGIPVLFIVFLGLLFFFQFKLHKSDISLKKARRKFWSFEEDSWFGRKATLGSDHFLHPDTSNLPKLSQDEFSDLDKDAWFKIQEKCFSLAKEPMVDLSNLLNSEIRHQYGATNLSTIEAYEDNYANYIKHLYLLGKFYFDLERFHEAQLFLEEGLHVQTEISDHLILLGTLYCKTRDEVHFLELYDYALNLKTLTQNKTLHQLQILKEANF